MTYKALKEGERFCQPGILYPKKLFCKNKGEILKISQIKTKGGAWQAAIHGVAKESDTTE